MTEAVPTRVLLVGAHGYGVAHLENLHRLRDRVRLVGTVDPQGPPSAEFGADLPHWHSLTDALEAERVDIVIIATPTGTHSALAAQALGAGADLYLEKPPVATMAQFEELLDLQRRTGAAVQVGFQSLGSTALEAIAQLGAPTSVAAWGSWVRDAAYWRRSRWAGKRELDGRPVVDGVVTNPLAHAVATGLRIAGARRREDVARVETQLLHANDIDADDTSAVRVTLADGRIVGIALTLCAEAAQAPMIEVRTAGTDARFSYTENLLLVNGESTRFPRRNLFEELLDHRDGGAPLSCSLVDCGAFMEVLEAVRRAPEPVAIRPEFFRAEGTGDRAHAVVDDVEWWVERAATAGALFGELAVPWAPTERTAHELPITLAASTGSVVVAVRNDGADVAATSSPRPYLHPIRTLGGVTVSDAHPLDHDWHLGLSFGMQHVDGVNFWGGRTYTTDQGYRWLGDQGRVLTRELEQRADGFAADGEWVAPDRRILLREATVVTAESSPSAGAWSFGLDWRLGAAGAPVELGSPATKGRVGAGYGGFSWRLPRVTDADVWTETARGEDAVHGTRSAWLALSGTFPDGPATLVVEAADAQTEADPWFVRMAAFPSIGAAVAWEHAVRLEPHAEIRRRYRVTVADGLLGRDGVREIIAGG